MINNIKLADADCLKLEKVAPGLYVAPRAYEGEQAEYFADAKDVDKHNRRLGMTVQEIINDKVIAVYSYLAIKDEKVFRSQEVIKNKLIVDFNREGDIIGVEVIQNV